MFGYLDSKSKIEKLHEYSSFVINEARKTNFEKDEAIDYFFLIFL